MKRADTQQFALYDAEATVDLGPRFENRKAIQAFYDDLRENAWFNEAYPMVHRLEVVNSLRPDRMGSVGDWQKRDGIGYIELIRPHWVLNYVLHEAAHCLAEARYPGADGHDPFFVKVYLELIYRVRGATAWRALRSALIAGGVQMPTLVSGVGAIPLPAKIAA